MSGRSRGSKDEDEDDDESERSESKPTTSSTAIGEGAKGEDEGETAAAVSEVTHIAAAEDMQVEDDSVLGVVGVEEGEGEAQAERKDVAVDADHEQVPVVDVHGSSVEAAPDAGEDETDVEGAAGAPADTDADEEQPGEATDPRSQSQPDMGEVEEGSGRVDQVDANAAVGGELSGDVDGAQGKTVDGTEREGTFISEDSHGGEERDDEEEGRQEQSVVEPSAAFEAQQRQRERRVRAAREGHFGGLSVPSMTAAATRIQSAWRSKCVRVEHRRLDFFAREMQRRVRGKQQRERFSDSLSRLRDLRKQESVRLERLRRIRTKERELTMLRSLPAEQFYGVDKLRRNNSARVLQRLWRAKTRGAAPIAEHRVEDPLHREADALLSRVSALLHPCEQDVGTSLKVEIDAYGLAQLHRRIKDAAEVRYRTESGQEQRELTSPLPKEYDMMNTGKHPFLARSKVFSAAKQLRLGGARKKYQEMLRAQQVSSVFLEEYQMSRHALAAAQHDRLASLGNCKTLIAQLKDPPSLDDATAYLQSIASTRSDPTALARGSDSDSNHACTSWFEGVQSSGLRDAVEKHLRTSSIMQAKNTKWSVVAAPHDVTGPPIDVTTLPSVQYSTLLNRLPIEHFNSASDKEESLWWVAYAAQKTRYAEYVESSSEEHSQTSALRGGWTTVGQPTGTDSQRAAQVLLGEVKGEDLLQRVAADVMTLPDRQAMLGKALDEEDLRVSRLARVLQEDIVRRILDKNGAFALGAFSEEAMRERHKACVRIQAFARGCASRVATSAKRAEARVIAALGVLISELSTSGLRAKSNKLAVKSNAGLLEKLKATLQPPMKTDIKLKQMTPPSVSSIHPTSYVSPLKVLRPSTRVMPKAPSSTPSLLSPNTAKRLQRLHLSPRTADKTNASSRLELSDTVASGSLNLSDAESGLGPMSYISSPSFRDGDSLDLDSPAYRQMKRGE